MRLKIERFLVPIRIDCQKEREIAAKLNSAWKEAIEAEISGALGVTESYLGQQGTSYPVQETAFKGIFMKPGVFA